MGQCTLKEPPPRGFAGVLRVAGSREGMRVAFPGLARKGRAGHDKVGCDTVIRARLRPGRERKLP